MQRWLMLLYTFRNFNIHPEALFKHTDRIVADRTGGATLDNTEQGAYIDVSVRDTQVVAIDKVPEIL